LVQSTLARKLRVLRAECGLTLREAEQLTSVDKDTLSKIERGLRHPYDVTLSKLARGYGVPVEELIQEPALAGKAEAPREEGLSEEREEERRLDYLRSWRAFVYKLIVRWQQDPPQSSREIAVVLDAMQALLEEGAFERPPEQITTSDKREASEWADLSSLFMGIDRLNQMADAVQADAEAERRRAAFRAIKGRMAG
jgi:transcriptional regulator with XRE-family HTH domain